MQSPRLAAPWAAVFALGVCPGTAMATYSIVAADTRTREVGGAGASCVYPSQVSVIFGVAPGFGAVHAQARANSAGRDRAAQLLAMGQAPADIIVAITTPSFDASAAQRQYGVVDVMGRSAGYTGVQNTMFADDVQGSAQGYVYSVQGNILTGAKVLEQAATAFESRGCDLAERLMLALEAGAANAQGDTRCTQPSDIAANSAFIQVDLPGMAAGSYLKLSSGSGRDIDPLPALRSAFNQWRVSHPCMHVDAGAFDAGAMPDAGANDASRPVDAEWAADALVQADTGASIRDASDGPAVDAAHDAASVSDGMTSPLAEAATMLEAGVREPGSDMTSSVDNAGCSALPGREPQRSGWLLLIWLAALRLHAQRRSSRAGQAQA